MTFAYRSILEAEFQNKKKNKIAFVTINRPKKMNAINYGVRKGLLKAWQRINDDPDVWLLILTGSGKAFSAGLDLDELVRHRRSLRICL